MKIKNQKMDFIKRDGSDSDLSDSWNVIDVKETPLCSESESIEVLDDDDDKETCSVENDRDCVKMKSSKIYESDKKVTECPSTHTNMETPVLVPRIEEIHAAEHNNRITRYYCVFPEEFYNMYHNTNNTVNTSEIVCSISLIVLCTVASSFMVICSDNLTPSFLDILVWQSLPEYQKDPDINNKVGLIIHQLNAVKERNLFLETKLNDLKVVEESMINEPAKFAEEKLTINELSSDRLLLSSFLTDQSANDPFKEEFITNAFDVKSEKSDFVYNVDHEVKKETVSKFSCIEKLKMQMKAISDFSPGSIEQKTVILLNKILLFFNVTSETGLLLNKACLVIMDVKDKLSVLKKVTPSINYANNVKCKKIYSDLENVNHQLNIFFFKVAHKIYNSGSKLNQMFSNFICKNHKRENGMLNDLCKTNHNFKYKTKQSYKIMNNNIKRNINCINRKQCFKANTDKLTLFNGNHYFSKLHKSSVDAAEKYIDSKEENTEKQKTTDITDNNIFYKNSKTYKSNKQDDNESVLPNWSKQRKTPKKIDKNKNILKTEENISERSSNEKNYLNLQIKAKEYNNVITNKRKKQLHKIFGKSSVEVKTPFDYSSISPDRNHYNYYAVNNKKIGKQKNENYKKIISENEEKSSKNKNTNFHTDIYSSKKSNYVNNLSEEKHKKESNKYHKTAKDSMRQGVKFDEKGTYDDFEKLKENILSFVRNYVDDLLVNLKYNSLDQNMYNNSTITSGSSLLPGDWFLTLGKKRSEIREKQSKSDWMYERAEGRHNLRDANRFYEQTWFFRRAWERNRFHFW
ncbi:uncharacterized protein LOC142326694 isoform X2 [Lycorma delicatula]|uniref:uncharacterized protein LOC142326694 isoform X2 n=1 Tax=Lycorma delicatula TaxID=130591 RepID=UPI003F515207